MSEWVNSSNTKQNLVVQTCKLLKWLCNYRKLYIQKTTNRVLAIFPLAPDQTIAHVAKWSSRVADREATSRRMLGAKHRRTIHSFDERSSWCVLADIYQRSPTRNNIQTTALMNCRGEHQVNLENRRNYSDMINVWLDNKPQIEHSVW